MTLVGKVFCPKCGGILKCSVNVLTHKWEIECNNYKCETKEISDL